MSRSLARSDAAMLGANLVGPAAWTAHLLVVYALVSIDCGSPRHVPELWYHAASAALGLGPLAGIAAGALAWRHPVAERGRRRRWMAATAIVASAFFLLGIVFGELPAVVLPRCP